MKKIIIVLSLLIYTSAIIAGSISGPKTEEFTIKSDKESRDFSGDITLKNSSSTKTNFRVGFEDFQNGVTSCESNLVNIIIAENTTFTVTISGMLDKYADGTVTMVVYNADDIVEFSKEITITYTKEDTGDGDNGDGNGEYEFYKHGNYKITDLSLQRIGPTLILAQWSRPTYYYDLKSTRCQIEDSKTSVRDSKSVYDKDIEFIRFEDKIDNRIYKAIANPTYNFHDIGTQYGAYTSWVSCSASIENHLQLKIYPFEDVASSKYIEAKSSITLKPGFAYSSNSKSNLTIKISDSFSTLKNASSDAITSDSIMSEEININPLDANLHLNEEIGFNIYPNPFKTILNIKPNSFDTTYSYQLLSINGSTVQQGTTEGDYQLNTGDLPSGIYFLIITDSDGKVHRHKVVK
ncbi:T9SS type A sorting domain-containing protein [Saccharicrinis aurantiacus]|uniref:T9SS type A sorting domain-containing protein n=1 Tax=Saccharicrinis aurantiacus TaxID=1849719 RepID=UPI00094F7EC8|nr:T9SS type A sorting domain-containing protein [Saccharicrinis aurantiacus]